MLEEQYRQGKITSALCFRLLEAYRQAEELSDVQKELQQDAVVQLAAAQIYSGAAQEETGLSPAPWNGFWPAGRRWRCSIIART